MRGGLLPAALGNKGIGPISPLSSRPFYRIASLKVLLFFLPVPRPPFVPFTGPVLSTLFCPYKQRRVCPPSLFCCFYKNGFFMFFAVFAFLFVVHLFVIPAFLLFSLGSSF